MDKIDIILEQQREMRDDIKELLKVSSTFQTIEKCEAHRDEIENNKKSNIKYIITTIIAFSGCALATIMALIK